MPLPDLTLLPGSDAYERGAQGPSTRSQASPACRLRRLAGTKKDERRASPPAFVTCRSLAFCEAAAQCRMALPRGHLVPRRRADRVGTVTPDREAASGASRPVSTSARSGSSGIHVVLARRNYWAGFGPTRRPFLALCTVWRESRQLSSKMRARSHGTLLFCQWCWKCGTSSGRRDPRHGRATSPAQP